MRISQPQFLTILFFVIIAYPLLLALPEAQTIAYAREDGPIEYAGAVFYFLAAVMMVAAFVGVSRTSSGGAYFLLLAVFFFVCFGEEISWGQRIIGWTTPEGLKDMNAQGETNLHNFWLAELGGAEISNSPRRTLPVSHLAPPLRTVSGTPCALSTIVKIKTLGAPP